MPQKFFLFDQFAASILLFCCVQKSRIAMLYMSLIFRGWGSAKGGFKSEDTGGVLLLQDKYSKSLSWAENLNKLFTD